MMDLQAADKVTTSSRNITDIHIMNWPDWESSTRARRVRVLDLLSRPSRGYRGPGTPWWFLRQGLTGRVIGTELRETLDDVLDAGLVVEAWLVPPSRRQTAHRIIRVEHWPADLEGYELLRVRGNPAVLRRLGYMPN